MEERKELDKLGDIEDRERLHNDNTYIRKIKKDINNTTFLNVDNIRLNYISENMDLRIEEIITIDKFVEYFKGSIKI